MGRVNLRSQNAGPMTVAQGDESLVFLSNFEAVTGGAQLYAGGEYSVSGGAPHTLTLPTDGNRFSLTVESGTARLSGATVDGVTFPTVTAGPKRTYYRVGTDWQLQSGGASSSTTTTVTASQAINEETQIIWVNSTPAITLSIPAGFADEHVFQVVRPQSTGAVTVLPDATEDAIDPVSGTPNVAGFILNQAGSAIFKKIAGDWHVAEG